MKVRAVIFDLDETLIEEETSNDASALAAGEIAQARRGVDRVALLAALRKRSRELFLAGPLIDYCRDIGISAREALWGTFSRRRSFARAASPMDADVQIAIVVGRAERVGRR